MQCFEHHEAPAIAICKVCNKGLCTDCAIDLDHAVSCSGECETEAQQLHVQILQNRKSMKTGRKSVYLWPLILFFMGTSMLVNEFVRHGPVLNWGSMFGGGILLFSIYMFVIYRKWGQEMDGSDGEDKRKRR